jgi:hypothetical protein
MLGIPLCRSTSRGRSDSEHRSSVSSSPSISQRSSPSSSPVKRPSNKGAQVVKRGSSNPTTICDSDTNNRKELKRTGKFNLKNLLAKIAGGSGGKFTQRHDSLDQASSESTPTRRHRPHLSLTTDRTSSSTSAINWHRSVSQPEQHKRSLSATGTLRRARINDSNSSVGSAVSQLYPVIASYHLSPSVCRASRHPGAPVGTRSLRSSAGSMLTAGSLPDSASFSSLGSVFSRSSHHSSGASHSLWTPFTSSSPGQSGTYCVTSLSYWPAPGLYLPVHLGAFHTLSTNGQCYIQVV